MTLRLWASRLFHTKPQDQMNLPIWSVIGHIGFSLPTAHLDPPWGLAMSNSIFREAKQNVCFLQSGLHTRKKEEKIEIPIPRSLTPIQKFKRPGIIAELLPHGEKHQKWGRIPTLPCSPFNKYEDVIPFYSQQ